MRPAATGSSGTRSTGHPLASEETYKSLRLEPAYMGDVAAMALTYGCDMAMHTPSSANLDAESAVDAATPAAATRPLPATLAREAGLVVAGAVALTLIGQSSGALPFSPVAGRLRCVAVTGAGAVVGASRGLA